MSEVAGLGCVNVGESCDTGVKGVDQGRLTPGMGGTSEQAPSLDRI